LKDILNALIEIQMECKECVEEFEGFPDIAKFHRWDICLEKAIKILKGIK